MSEEVARPLRADAIRSVNAILKAAEHVLSADPTASMEQIAQVAGVTRTTIHRRFTHRQALIDALALSAVTRLSEAVDDGRPDTAPPLIALHQITANVVSVKREWNFALGLPAADGTSAASTHASVDDTCIKVLRRARDSSLIDESVDLEWARSVYYALLDASLRDSSADDGLDSDALAARIVDTLLRGIGPHAG